MAEQPSTVSADDTPISPEVILQIEKVCEEFEEGWQASRPDAGAFLARVPPEGQAILRVELAAIDDHFLKQGGSRRSRATKGNRLAVAHRTMRTSPANAARLPTWRGDKL